MREAWGLDLFWRHRSKSNVEQSCCFLPAEIEKGERNFFVFQGHCMVCVCVCVFVCLYVCVPARCRALFQKLSSSPTTTTSPLSNLDQNPVPTFSNLLSVKMLSSSAPSIPPPSSRLLEILLLPPLPLLLSSSHFLSNSHSMPSILGTISEEASPPK